MASSAYVVITPARNEADYIELTLQSMVAQTVVPARWVIVSDGSTDGTDEIVARYAQSHSWIRLVRMPERRERHFAGKVHAFNAGYTEMAGLDYDVIVSLDADISFEPDYFSFLLEQLAANPSLGVAGTAILEGTRYMYDYGVVSSEHVSGACQVFRRECFESFGGYKPLRSGGIDLVAVLSARRGGWTTRSFREKYCLHHRPMNGAEMSGLRERLHRGRMDYLLGSHPVWELFRGIYQMTRPPYLIGGTLILASYFWRQAIRAERSIPPEIMAFRRKEQMGRLRQQLRGAVRLGESGGEAKAV